MPAQAVFTQRECHPTMNPKGVKARQSRDSVEHPNTVSVVFALDVSGSMGAVPEQIARHAMPTFMKSLLDAGIADPQVLFMAFQDAAGPEAPLQVGQFESTAELMDQWLTWSWLEAGGGGNGSESYDLAFYTLAQHVDADCWVKRRKRGYLFMTGDELPYPAVSRHHIEAVFGEKLDEDIPVEEVVAAAAESFHLFFLVPDLARRKRCEARWRELLGDQVICMESADDTCAVAAGIVSLTERALPSMDAYADALKAQGVPAERIGAVVRALRPYAATLRGADGRPVASSTGAAAPSSWWRKLFR